MTRKLIYRITFGIPVGIMIGLLISLSFSYIYGQKYYPSAPRFENYFDNPLNAFAISILLWALMGIVFSISSVIFEQDAWSIAKQTSINFVITYFGFTFLAILAHWFPLNAPWLIIYTLIYIVIYFVIWAVQYLVERNIVRTINQKISK